ncbi:hypothetical protein [Mesorhizobium ventifaucium]|uniref:Uncharacterized protein n=1 Tax=Mesorhizobium ventifaucium TaxID=666020 RepID=A0ABM9E8C6_9HYPH|nr:hypothetical protein [Mesorhizobium ventifaucium]CAH2404996.1 hypothetical protein MES4922_40010 [Mesorhizobium ventifaucium]
MATSYQKPGIILIFDQEVWYQPVKQYSDLKAEIDNIKSALVDPANQQRVLKTAVQLQTLDELELLKVEKDDIRDLLLGGVTIRPTGK